MQPPRGLPLEQYAGGAPTPIAVYRPGNIFGGGAVVADAQSFGVAHFRALAVLENRDTQLKAREQALIAAAETLTDPDAILEALNASAEERMAIGKEREQLAAQIAGEARRRDLDAHAPTLEVDEEELAAKAVEEKAKADAAAPKPFASLGEQLAAVHAAAIAKQNGGSIHPGLRAIQDYQRTQAAAHGATETVGSDGGFLVQTDLNNELLGDIIQAGQLASLARPIEVGPNSNGVKFNVFDETSRATGSRYGGVRAYWIAEAGQKTASRPKLRQIEIILQKMAAMYVATDELLGDTTALESVVRPAFIEEMAFVLDDAMIRGTGAGMPLGILNADVLVTVSKETNQPADTVILENVDKMLVRILPGSVAKASWYINQEIWPQLFNLQQVIGLGGVPAFIAPGQAGASPFGTLRGRPVQVIEQGSAIGDLGDIILADWSQYAIVRKGGIQSASSIHVYFDTDETAFRWVMRVNGRPWRHSSVTPYKGSGTLSPFVALQAR
jgi:HK97 family phage major capsid protein